MELPITFHTLKLSRCTTKKASPLCSRFSRCFQQWPAQSGRGHSPRAVSVCAPRGSRKRGACIDVRNLYGVGLSKPRRSDVALGLSWPAIFARCDPTLCQGNSQKHRLAHFGVSRLGPMLPECKSAPLASPTGKLMVWVNHSLPRCGFLSTIRH